MRLAIRRLREDARLPTRAHHDDAGLDLYAIESVTLAPGARAIVGTGIALEIPERHAGLVLPRSGLAARHGVTVVNAPGLIDAGYRGEIRVVLLNTDRTEAFTLEAGERMAQLVISRIETPDLVEVAELPPTRRADGGFGSSGR